jgi:proteic killer suppression protein
MQVEFEDPDLQRLEAEVAFTAGLAQPLVTMFRRRMQLIRAAVDIRAFYALKSLHFEKLKGDREGQYSMRLNEQWRLIVRLEQNPDGTTVVIVSIVDYH